MDRYSRKIVRKGTTLLYMGAAYHDEKKTLDEAITYYQKALAIEQNHPGVHNDLGDALRDKGMLDLAIKEYKAALC